jgi:hypothetical protein
MNQHLDDMVMALVNHDNDKAKEHLSNFFSDAGAKAVENSMNAPQQTVTESNNTLWLPEKWASALINNDKSGLDSEEKEELNKWTKANPEYSEPLSVDDEPAFMRHHDASDVVAATNCLKYHYKQ